MQTHSHFAMSAIKDKNDSTHLKFHLETLIVISTPSDGPDDCGQVP